MPIFLPLSSDSNTWAYFANSDPIGEKRLTVSQITSKQTFKMKELKQQGMESSEAIPSDGSIEVVVDQNRAQSVRRLRELKQVLYKDCAARITS